MIEQHENALKVMQALTGVGCTLALDDYGAGHSGLTNLQRYPFNAVKIDRAFVNLVLVSTQSQEIVRSSILLSHSLGMKVVAEGIETEGV
jgi:EAL domain-containing protein (putative c-di-GMP-specific phosphodiesterase class I)